MSGQGGFSAGLGFHRINPVLYSFFVEGPWMVELIQGPWTDVMFWSALNGLGLLQAAKEQTFRPEEACKMAAVLQKLP